MALDFATEQDRRDHYARQNTPKLRVGTIPEIFISTLQAGEQKVINFAERSQRVIINNRHATSLIGISFDSGITFAAINAQSALELDIAVDNIVVSGSAAATPVEIIVIR